VLSGRGLCDELITRPEESYRLCCVVVCDLETSRMRRLWPALGCSATAKSSSNSSSSSSSSNGSNLITLFSNRIPNLILLKTTCGPSLISKLCFCELDPWLTRVLSSLYPRMRYARSVTESRIKGETERLTLHSAKFSPLQRLYLQL